MSIDASLVLDAPVAGSIHSDAFGIRVYVEAEGVSLCLRLDDLDELERLLDDLQQDVVTLRRSEQLSFVAKPAPDGTLLRFAMQAPGHHVEAKP